MSQRIYTLIDADGRPYRTPVPGRFGGHRRSKIYGHLDCPSALRALTRGHYHPHRVFFADEATAIGAGYRPCASCMKARYAVWKAVERGGGRSVPY
ncbi:Ada metal-binding domain-containing protein [Nocardia sp. NPDC057440]|uniref:Ada metal-binding domain-containing protein n=1 Tax=Nocardia sp. NPDC057440 TaxID=3346134 RepID=UPI00366ABBD8